MAKFDAYPKADTVLPDDLLITDGTRGTKTVKTSEAVYKFFEPIPQMHKVIWRGKNLGSRYTPEQQAAVANGTLTDIWLGDYWEKDGIKWTIVDFEAANQTMQDLPSTYLTIMPDQSLGRAEMLTGDVNVAMQDTHIYSNLVTWQLYKFEAVFGASHILEHIVSSRASGQAETGNRCKSVVLSATPALRRRSSCLQRLTGSGHDLSVPWCPDNGPPRRLRLSSLLLSGTDGLLGFLKLSVSGSTPEARRVITAVSVRTRV